VSGTFVYTPPAGTILTAGMQTLSVTFTPSDSVDYTTATATVYLTVSKGTATITWGALAPITYGTPLGAAQLNASANVPGTFVYSPSAGTVLGAGSQTLSVTFTPTDSKDYSSAMTTNVLVVSKAMPVITWPTPAPIPYGTRLSSAQLDATANVPGKFVYSPMAGTILPAGNQTLSVTFTPIDSVDYTSATASVTVLVTQPLISFSPSSVNFGTVKWGSVSTIAVTVSNPGTAPLNISSIAFAGRNEDLDLFYITNNCKSSVAPGGSCGFKVTFLALEVESFNFTILVCDNAPGSPQQIPVTASVTKH
jgi:Abnormal spindle-like microcephaly-assoc'd, ASPM-SPD-2-Hydin